MYETDIFIFNFYSYSIFGDHFDRFRLGHDSRLGGNDQFKNHDDVTLVEFLTTQTCFLSCKEQICQPHHL